MVYPNNKACNQTKGIKGIKPLKSGAGFTLIETLIYIALLSFLMGSLLGITYQALASTSQINKRIVIQQESNFILRKLDWALMGAQTITLPGVNSGGSELKLSQYTGTNNSIDFIVQNENIYLSLAGASVSFDNQLNNQNVIVSNFMATTSRASLEPEEVQVGFTLAYTTDSTQSESFQLTKYLRE